MITSLAVLGTLVFNGMAMATIYHVKPDGSGDFPTIQSAIDSVLAGDVIELADGTFTGPGNENIFYRGKAITVRSQSGNPDACIIDAEYMYHPAFHFSEGEGHDSVLEGVTITRSNPGMVVESAPSIVNCRIVDNASFEPYGTRWGGGINVSGDAAFSDCTIAGNSAMSDNFGDASRGGGVYCSSSATFTNCTISNNHAGQGGGIYCQSGWPSFIGCEISGNRDDWSEWYEPRGAVLIENAAASFTSCLFSDNGTDSDFAGTVYAVGGGISLENCTIHGSRGDHAIFISGGALGMSKVIMAFGSGSVQCGGSAYHMIDCCDFYGNTGGDWTGCLAGMYGQNGNFSADPLFCDPESGDFSLHSDSPCAEGNNLECYYGIGAFPVGCSAYFNAVWDAGDELLPEVACPPWAPYQHGHGEAYFTPDGDMAVQASQCGWDVLAYMQDGDAITMPDRAVVEARIRYASGDTCTACTDYRRNIGIGVTTVPNIGVTLFIGRDEVFITQGGSCLEANRAYVDTDNSMHTYLLEVGKTDGSVRVLYDGAALLTGTTYMDNGEHGPEPRVWWGHGTYQASGEGRWTFVRHNAHATGCAPAGVHETAPGSSSLRIFPNPSMGVVHLSLEGEAGEAPAGLHVYDLGGRLVRDLGAACSAKPAIWFWDGCDDQGHTVPTAFYHFADPEDRKPLGRVLLLRTR